jgi:hypothetical protein
MGILKAVPVFLRAMLLSKVHLAFEKLTCVSRPHRRLQTLPPCARRYDRPQQVTVP